MEAYYLMFPDDKRQEARKEEDQSILRLLDKEQKRNKFQISDGKKLDLVKQPSSSCSSSQECSQNIIKDQKIQLGIQGNVRCDEDSEQERDRDQADQLDQTQRINNKRQKILKFNLFPLNELNQSMSRSSNSVKVGRSTKQNLLIEPQFGQATWQFKLNNPEKEAPVKKNHDLFNVNTNLNAKDQKKLPLKKGSYFLTDSSDSCNKTQSFQLEKYNKSKQLTAIDGFKKQENNIKSKQNRKFIPSGLPNEQSESNANQIEMLQKFELIRNFQRDSNLSPEDLNQLPDKLDQANLSRISKKSIPFFNESSQFDHFSENENNIMQQNHNMFDHSSSGNETKQLFKNEVLIKKDSRERFNGILKARMPFQQQSTQNNDLEFSADSFTAAQHLPMCVLCSIVYENNEKIENRPLKLYCCESTICGQCLHRQVLLHQPSYRFRIKCKLCSNFIDGKYINERQIQHDVKLPGMINFGDQFLKNVSLLANAEASQIKTAICTAHITDFQIIEKIEILKFKRIKNPNSNPYLNQVKEWQINMNKPSHHTFMFYFNQHSSSLPATPIQIGMPKTLEKIDVYRPLNRASKAVKGEVQRCTARGLGSLNCQDAHQLTYLNSEGQNISLEETHQNQWVGTHRDTISKQHTMNFGRIERQLNQDCGEEADKTLELPTSQVPQKHSNMEYLRFDTQNSFGVVLQPHITSQLQPQNPYKGDFDSTGQFISNQKEQIQKQSMYDIVPKIDSKDVFDGYYKLIDLQSHDFIGSKKRNSVKARLSQRNNNQRDTAQNQQDTTKVLKEVTYNIRDNSGSYLESKLQQRNPVNIITNKQINSKDDLEKFYSSSHDLNSTQTLKEYKTNAFCDSPTLYGSKNNKLQCDDLVQNPQKIHLQGDFGVLNDNLYGNQEVRESEDLTDKFGEEVSSQANTPRLSNHRKFNFDQSYEKDHQLSLDHHYNHKVDFLQRDKPRNISFNRSQKNQVKESIKERADQFAGCETARLSGVSYSSAEGLNNSSLMKVPPPISKLPYQMQLFQHQEQKQKLEDGSPRLSNSSASSSASVSDVQSRFSSAADTDRAANDAIQSIKQLKEKDNNQIFEKVSILNQQQIVMPLNGQNQKLCQEDFNKKIQNSMKGHNEQNLKRLDYQKNLNQKMIDGANTNIQTQNITIPDHPSRALYQGSFNKVSGNEWQRKSVDPEENMMLKNEFWHEILIKDRQSSLQNYVCFRCCPAGELSVHLDLPYPPGFSQLADHQKLQKIVSMHIDSEQELELAREVATCSKERRKEIIRAVFRERFKLIRWKTSLGIMKLSLPQNLDQFNQFIQKEIEFDLNIEQQPVEKVVKKKAQKKKQKAKCQKQQIQQPELTRQLINPSKIVPCYRLCGRCYINYKKSDQFRWMTEEYTYKVDRNLLKFVRPFEIEKQFVLVKSKENRELKK